MPWWRPPKLPIHNGTEACLGTLMCVLVGTSAVRLSLYAAKRVTMDPVAAANIKGARECNSCYLRAGWLRDEDSLWKAVMAPHGPHMSQSSELGTILSQELHGISSAL